MLAQLLRSSALRRVTAWERDPWMLRLALERQDFSTDIAAGRLVLRMGVDLLAEVPVPSGQWLEHPVLASHYALERRLLSEGWKARRALVCQGGLFVDDVAEALGEEGYSVYPLETQKLSAEELGHVLSVARPQLVAAINYTPGLAEFLGAHSVKFVMWEVDPATDRLAPVEGGTDHAHLFTYRRAHVDDFSRIGFRHVEYLPLAANVRRRAPVQLSSEEQARYGAPISFVGSSMVEQSRAYRAQFVSRYVRWRQRAQAAEEAEEALAAALAVQSQDFSRYLLAEELTSRLPAFFAETRMGGQVDPLLLAAEVAASEKRLAYAGGLGALGLTLWGDPGWESLTSSGCRYLGRAGHFQELNKIYSGSLINLDIGRLYQSDIVTMRIFDVLACGGFVLAERSAELEALFELGAELEAYSTFQELGEKVKHYLAHPEQARAIAERGRAAVHARHSTAMRVRHMLERAGLSKNA